MPTLAGAGLVLLFPPAAFGGPSSVQAIAPMVHLVPLAASVVVVAAWVVFHLHVSALRAPWRRDRAAVGLMVVGALGVLVTVGCITLGWLAGLILAVAVTAGVHLALAHRIDMVRRRVPRAGASPVA